MANYYVDKNGDITLGKKKKKFEDNDIAPVKTSAKTKASAQKNNDVAPSWLEKGAFADGYDFGDITKTILGTGYDITKNLTAGVLGMGEKAVDAVALGVGKTAEKVSDKSSLEKVARTAGAFVANPILGISSLAGSLNDDLPEQVDEFIKKDLYDENKVADWVAPVLQPGLAAGKLIGLHDGEEDSVLGSKSDSLVQSAGQLGATAALQAVGVPWWATTAITSYGGEVENALNQGATRDEAMLSGAISAGVEILTEKISGAIGFPGMGAFDEGFTKILARNISNKAWRTALKIVGDVAGEGIEEIASGLGTALGQKFTYADEKELNELFSSEDAWESFIGGAVLGGAGGAVQAVGKKAQGRDYASGLTANEEAVVKKLYEAELAEAKKNGTKVNKNDLWDSIVKQMDRGEISIDTIEEVLGGDEYTAYKSLVDEQNAHLKDLAKMFEGDELKAQKENYLSDSKRGEMKSQLRKNVFGKVITEKGSRLLNSYAETEARGKKFTANLDDYEGEYAKKTIQNIIDAESGNNTRRMHELADLLAKTSEDKKTVFSITDAKKLAGTSFAFKDQTTDGYVVRDADGVVKEVVINLDSPKYLNRVVGHEVTHILEGTEFYDTFRGVVEEYAKSKGEYDTELANAIGLYSDKDGYKGQAGLENIKKEVVANLAGKYIFSDTDFVKTLSVKNRNIFEKVYDEIKYFCKVAKAGSKEEKQLLKVKKAFEDAYRAEGVKKTDAMRDSVLYEGQVQYSLSSIGNAFFGDPNMSAEEFEKADYTQTQGYKDYLSQCVNNVKQSKQPQYSIATDAEIEQELGKQIRGIIDVAIAAKQAGYDIFDDPKKRDLRDSKNRLLFSSLEPNSDYFTSNDISSICDKRKNFAEIYDEIVRQEEAKGVPVGKRFFDNVDNYFAIHKIMADKGLTTPCRQCYVESMRKNLAPMAKSFLQLVNETDPNNKFNDQLYHTKGKKKGELKTGNADTRTHTLDALEEYGMSAENLTVEMLTTAEGLATLKITAPKVYEQFNSFYGQSKPKMPRGATPFRLGELTALLTDHKGKINETLVNRINSTGGFRLQSYSDFQIENFVDTLQVLFEAGTLGLRGHSYTKVPAFLDATEGTNLKRNISIFMYKDGNEWKLDRNDSFPYSLEEIYDIVNGDSTGNTGIIAVSQNEDMSCWIMANDYIGYFIPFHKSGIKMDTVRDTNVVTEDGRTIKGYSGIKDHTKQQSEVWAFTNADHKVGTKVKKGINIYSFWDFKNADNLSKHELIEKNVKAYIDACEDAGYLPKFRELVTNNRGILNKTLQYAKELGTVPQDATISDIAFEYKGYTIPYGYYKCLGDFGMFTPDGRASSQEVLSLKDYDFNKAVEFFKDSEALRREEILQQFANGEERQKYRDSDLTAEQLIEIVKQKRTDVAKDVIDNRYAKAMSLSDNGIAPVSHSATEISGADVRLQTPVAEVAPVAEIANPTTDNGFITNPVDASVVADDIAPISVEEQTARDRERLASLNDSDMPPVAEEPYYGEPETPVAPKDPFEERDFYSIGKNRKAKAFMWDNPEVKPYFQQAAKEMLWDLNNSEKGERYPIKDADGYIVGWDGLPRNTTDDIAELLDNTNDSYEDIRKGLNAIIEDNGKENNAVSKRIEFILNDRLMKGYTDIFGEKIPANQEYINLLSFKQTTDEAYKQYQESLEYIDEDIAPAAEPVAPAPVKDDSAPTSQNTEERRWVGTSTSSEAVDGAVTPDDIPDELRYYQVKGNKQTLETANTRLNNMGYDRSVTYFKGKLSERKVTVEDIALGERLIQEAVKAGDTKTAMDLIADVSILGTELGQKVQALSIIKKLTPEGQLGMLQKIVERGKAKGDKAYDGVEVTEAQAETILKTRKKDGTYDQDELNKAVEDAKQQIADQMKVTGLEKVNAWRYLSMLGNPKTHIRNLVSNVAMRVTIAAKNAVARTIEDIAPVKNRTKTWKSASDTVKEYAQKTTMEMKDIISDGGKYNEEASLKAMRKTFKNKVLNRVYEFNSDMLSREDWWFSKSVFQKSFSEFLTANGIETEQDIYNNPETIEKARNYALEQSQIATFRQYSWLANKINEIERKNIATNIAVGSIVPFKKTPINIAKTGLNYSPLGFAKTLTYDAVQVKNGNMEASEMIDHLSQNVTGTALTLVGYMLASMGFLNGGGEDDKEGKYDYQLGEQAYSVNIGGATFSLSWLSPIAMPLFVGANAYEQLVEGKEWNGDVVVETLAQTLDPLSEMSFLSSLDTVLSSYDSGIQKFAGIGESMAQNYITQFVPTLSSQLAATIDDTKRTTKVSGDSDFKFFDQTINNLKYKIPFLRQTLEPTTDIWGNEVKQTENLIGRAVENFIAPYARKENIATEIDEEIKALYSETGDSGLIPSVPYNYVNYDGEKYKMSAKEFTEYKKLYGQNAYDLMEDLFATSVYQNATDEEKADMVNKVYDYARDEATKNLLEGRDVHFTNAESEGTKYYRVNPIKGAIENNMYPDEYTFYTKYPEKYRFLKDEGVSYKEWDAFDEDTKRAYTWLYENPTKKSLVKAVTNDVVKYRSLSGAMYDIKADKDSSGKSISGSRKEKVIDYINGLDLDYGEKIILFKNEYNSDDTYNWEIIEYLNGRSDISYKEMEAILKELGFTVHSDGRITWD